MSWFGIGCYYMCIGRHADARRYFGKATALDPTFSPAWLGFGHAFAAQDESDQVRLGTLNFAAPLSRKQQGSLVN